MLRNICNASDIGTDQEYFDLKEDIREECAKFGVLKTMEFPRPVGYQDTNPILGCIYLEYTTVEEAKEARRVFLSKGNNF
jgi:splicing factor U2AF subunit